MATHLAEIPKLYGEIYGAKEHAIMDAVIEDLVESFALSLSTTELSPERQAAVLDSVRDAITNNYDCLDD